MPIVLHLIMRQQPTLLEFPALRFIQKRHDANRRRLQLRHLLLLLLRAAAIALLAFALARPSVKLAGALGSQETPVAAALVFDAAPHMEYRHENHTRLEAGPGNGPVAGGAIARARARSPCWTRGWARRRPFSPIAGAAKERIDRLETVANSQPLTGRARSGRQARCGKSQLERKEIYVFTDLSRGAWPAEQAAQLQQRLADAGRAGRVHDRRGRAQADELSAWARSGFPAKCFPHRSTLTARNAAFVPGDCRRPGSSNCTSADAQRQAPKTQRAKLRGHARRVAAGGVSPRRARAGHAPGFCADGGPGRTGGRRRAVLHRGGEAGLAGVGGRAPAAANLCRVLDPGPGADDGPQAADRPASIATSAMWANWPSGRLADYAAVCLLDPTPLDPPIWQKLADFAAEGHGVAVFLGRNAKPVDSFNEPAGAGIAPRQAAAAGAAARRRLAPGPPRLPASDPGAPSAARPAAIPWEAFPVFRYWQLDDRRRAWAWSCPTTTAGPPCWNGPSARDAPLTMTTPVSDRARSQNPWNLLPVGDGAWPFVILANQMVAYLVGGGEQHWNYFAGQTAVVPLGAAAQRRDYLLSTPGKLSFPLPADLKRHEVAVTATDQVGNYRLQAGGSERRGFRLQRQLCPRANAARPPQRSRSWPGCSAR